MFKFLLFKPLVAFSKGVVKNLKMQQPSYSPTQQALFRRIQNWKCLLAMSTPDLVCSNFATGVVIYMSPYFDVTSQMATVQLEMAPS